MRKPFLECGKIVSTHGVLGEMRVQPWCDSPEDLEGIKTLYFDGGAAPAEVLRARAHKNVVLLKLRGVDTVEQAQALRGRVLWVAREDMPLEEGEYFIQDLLGMQVVDADDGHPYGVLSDVSETRRQRRLPHHLPGWQGAADSGHQRRGGFNRPRAEPDVDPAAERAV